VTSLELGLSLMPRHRRDLVEGNVSTSRRAHAKAEVEALMAVFASQYGRLCSLAAALTGDRSQAEDYVMDAFARVWARGLPVSDPTVLAAYVHAAVVNRSKDALRRRGIESRANSAYVGRQRGEEAWAEPKDTNLLTAIRTLPARQQAAIVLRYYNDLPEADIGQVLGCTTGTVKSQLAKARRHLARVIASQEARQG